MANLEDLGELISTDVLIVGGGIGGLVAAIKVKESAVDVLVVEKQTIGWSGKAPKGGGVLWVVTPEENLDEFVEYHVKNIGDYLNDQELLYSFAGKTYAAIKQLEDWGVKTKKDENGKLAIFPHYSARKCSLAGVDLDMLIPLRARAKKLGAKILNKLQVVDLLKEDDRVVGAVGFDIISGRFYVIKSKATVLANGSCDYKVMRMWGSASGEGIAAAYRAGAKMRNAEFGNFYDVVRKNTGAAAPAGHSFLYNEAGENISNHYMTAEEKQDDINIGLALGMEKEAIEGSGPIYLDMVQRTARRSAPAIANLWDRPKFQDFTRRTVAKEAKYGPPVSSRPEVTLAFHGELSPVKVDHDMKTNLAGLWAIGDTSYEGSAWAGAVFAPPARIRGSGLMNAILSALIAGPLAAEYASRGVSHGVNYTEIKKMKEEIFTPMKYERGISSIDIVCEIQDLVCPTRYNLRRSKERLEEALSRLKEIQNRLPGMKAIDGHELANCVEAKSMALCAEMTFRAALMRTESRGWHFREDYPQRDDKNWLKWIIIQQLAGEMNISTEPVPVGKYKFQP